METLITVLTIINAIYVMVSLVGFFILWPKKKKIFIKETEWATQVRTLAHQFTAIEHDIRDGKYGPTNDMMVRIKEDIQRTNGMTHSLWDRMANELKVK